MTKEKLAKQIIEAINWCKKTDTGCFIIKLDNRLAVCVGWLDGYDPEDEHCIHSKSEPTYCLNVGIKVHTSDFMCTDYEYLNAPFYRSGDVWMTDVSIDEDEDVEALVDYLLREYEAMKKLDIAEDGEILNFDSPDGYCKYNEVE